MFELYTEEARRVIFFARYEASVAGSSFIKAEHLLLGFFRQEKESPHPLNTGLDTIRLRAEIENSIERSHSISTSNDMPVSVEARSVLSFAAQEARNLESPHIGMEHLLLGFLREEKSSAGRLLREQGLDVAAQRQRLQPPGA